MLCRHFAIASLNPRGHHDSTMKSAMLVALVCMLRFERSESFMVSGGVTRGACSFKRKRGRPQQQQHQQHQQRVSRRVGSSLMQAPGGGAEWEVGGRGGGCTAVSSSREWSTLQFTCLYTRGDTEHEKNDNNSSSSSNNTDLHHLANNISTVCILI